MSSSKLKEKSKQNLEGRWGKAALLVLIYFVFTISISQVSEIARVFGSIAIIVIQIPITYGFIAMIMDLKNKEEVSYFTFLKEAKENFGKSWKVYGKILLKLLVPIIIMVIALVVIFYNVCMMININKINNTSYFLVLISLIPLIGSSIYLFIKSLNYSLVWFIMHDNSDMTAKEIVEKSEELMKNNRCKLIWLNITFIGWLILLPFTLGIGILWLSPYIVITTIYFYENLLNKEVNLEDLPDEMNLN